MHYMCIYVCKWYAFMWGHDGRPIPLTCAVLHHIETASSLVSRSLCGDAKSFRDAQVSDQVNCVVFVHMWTRVCVASVCNVYVISMCTVTYLQYPFAGLCTLHTWFHSAGEWQFVLCPSWIVLCCGGFVRTETAGLGEWVIDDRRNRQEERLWLVTDDAAN